MNGQETEYTTAGSTILKEKNSAYELYYYYDSAGNLISLGYKANGSTVEIYYFVTRNAQGDIVAIYKSSDSTLVGTYTYDTWGKVLSITPASGTSDPNGILGKNPFRYRGYYLDDETGFYYLQSRYYDPEVKRFINADGLISTGTGVMGYNMYAYCNNNSVNLVDPSGMCSSIGVGSNYQKIDCKSINCKTSSYYSYQSYTSPKPPPPPDTISPPTSNYNRDDIVHGTDGQYCTSPGCSGHSGGNIHRGTDILGKNGDILFAPIDGYISFSGYAGGRGYYIDIISWDGTMVVQYQHCNENAKNLTKYETVSAGDSLGNIMGRTGFVRNVDGIVHVEVRRNGILQSTNSYLP